MAKSFFFLVGLFFCWGNAQAEEARIAVASNFSKTMMELKRVFELSEPHSLSLIFGSTGKLYAQIRNGAPFDVLLSADQEAPRALYESSADVYAEPFTYAIGKIALWSSWQGPANSAMTATVVDTHALSDVSNNDHSKEDEKH